MKVSASGSLAEIEMYCNCTDELFISCGLLSCAAYVLYLRSHFRVMYSSNVSKKWMAFPGGSRGISGGETEVLVPRRAWRVCWVGTIRLGPLPHCRVYNRYPLLALFILKQWIEITKVMASRRDVSPPLCPNIILVRETGAKMAQERISKRRRNRRNFRLGIISCSNASNFHLELYRGCLSASDVLLHVLTR